MKEQFVPATIAQQLKEKGFDESCMAYVYTGNTGTNVDQYVYGAISHDGNPRCENYNAYDMSYSLPLWQQVIDWLREKHNLRIFESTPIAGLSSKSFNEDFRFELVKISGNGGHANSVFGNGGLGSRYQTYSSYNEARQAVIEHALTLI